MMENNKQEIIVVTISNSDGERIEYEILFVLELNSIEYAVLIDREKKEDILILKVEGSTFEPIQDKKEFQEVYQAFYQYLLNNEE